MKTVKVKRKQGIVTMNEKDFVKGQDTLATADELKKEDARIVKVSKDAIKKEAMKPRED